MFGKTFDVVRIALLVTLVSTFGWQTIYSINKYFQYDIMTTFAFEHPASQVFPSISICGFKRVEGIDYDEHNDDYLYWTFTEELDNAVLPKFVAYFEHDKLDQITLDGEHPDNEEDEEAPDDPRNDQASKEDEYNHEDEYYASEEFISKYVNAWSTRPYFLPSFNPNITYCMTYKPPEKFSGGGDSILTININMSQVDKLELFLHSAQNGVIMANPIYGTSKLKNRLTTLSKEGQSFMFKISTAKKFVRERDNLPCHNHKYEEDNFLLSCVESWFERENHCKLPWTATENLNKNLNQCNSSDSLKEYKHQNYRLYDSGPVDLYKRTGCYFSCEYLKFDAELFEEGSGDEGLLSIALFLAPDGITVDREVLAFDFYDLMGNVGGFLGLFLGASILSMYDSLKSNLTKMKKYKKKSIVKKIPTGMGMV